MTEEKDKVIALNLGCCREAAVVRSIAAPNGIEGVSYIRCSTRRSDGLSKYAGTAVVDIPSFVEVN